jgi:hypothetical protein
MRKSWSISETRYIVKWLDDYFSFKAPILVMKDNPSRLFI